MQRELLIMRHGKSDWSRPVSDVDRPLKKRGRNNAGLLGKWLARQGLVPDRVVSSPAVRALETARIVVARMGLPEKIIVTEPGMYLADDDELLHFVQGIPDSVGRLLLVGHNPGMEDLVTMLASRPPVWPANNKLMPTAALAVFRCPISRWKELKAGNNELVRIIRPRELRMAP